MRYRLCTRPALFIALAASLALLAPAMAGAQAYPRLGMYGSIFDDGYPLWDANGNFTPVIDELARYHQVILDASPITPYRPDAAEALRARRPDIQLLAYVLGQDMWEASGADSTTHFPMRYNGMIRSMGGYLYNRSGGYYTGGRINLAKRVSGRYVVAEAIADLFNTDIIQPGIWDGIFIDVFCSYIVWTQSPAESIDIVRAGYTTQASFDAAWHAAADTLGDRLRRYGGPDFILVGNCAQGDNYDAFNGWMRENFPFQNGADWYSNMFREVGGYLRGDLNFRSPHYNYISSIPQGTPITSATNARRARYGLGSASLGDGFGVINVGNRSVIPTQYMSWWFDEFAVNRITGMASTMIQHTGWLGQPLVPYYQMIWVGTAPDAVTNPDFETSVVNGWDFSSTIGGTRSHDQTTAGKGTSSIKVHIPVADPVNWRVWLASTGTIFMGAGQIHSATFWAKASTPRPITVVAGLTVGGLAEQTVDIGTTWRQYQVPMIPNASGSVVLRFHLAQAAGDVWIDDAHLQAGATTLYRRDFQNGIVLVNPSNTPLTVPLERPMRRIQGLVDPIVNNGVQSSSATVGAADALFLLGDDQLAPSTILDLQVVGSALMKARGPRTADGTLVGAGASPRSPR